MRLLVILLLFLGCCKKTIKPVIIEKAVPNIIKKETPVTEEYWPDEKELRDTFYFGFDCDELNREEAERLLRFIQKIPKNQVVYVKGGCCPIGSEEYNMGLGYRRAKYGQYYVNLVKDNEVLIDSYGEGNLVSKTDYPKNRRIELETKNRE